MQRTVPQSSDSKRQQPRSRASIQYLHPPSPYRISPPSHHRRHTSPTSQLEHTQDHQESSTPHQSIHAPKPSFPPPRISLNPHPHPKPNPHLSPQTSTRQGNCWFSDRVGTDGVARTLGECRLDEWWFRLDCVGGGWRILRGGCWRCRCDKLGFFDSGSTTLMALELYIHSLTSVSG